MGKVLEIPGTRRGRGIDAVDIGLFKRLLGGCDIGNDGSGLLGGVSGTMLGLGIAELA